MLARRKLAKDYLHLQDRQTFEDIVYQAKVTPVEREILYLDVLEDKDHNFIADMVGLTENRVNHKMGEAYDAIYRYLLKNNIFSTLL